MAASNLRSIQEMTTFIQSGMTYYEIGSLLQIKIQLQEGFQIELSIFVLKTEFP